MATADRSSSCGASFPIEADESPATAGLAPWVYDVDASEVRLDLPATRKLAGEVAIAYGTASKSRDGIADRLRVTAAGQLQALADGRCRAVTDEGEAQEP